MSTGSSVVSLTAGPPPAEFNSDIETQLQLLLGQVRTVFKHEPKNIQIQAWRYFLERKHVFVIAPTGYGKGLIIQGLSLVSAEAIVLVLVPLKAIMIDQVKNLELIC